jgi:hypothetical protein
MDSALNRPVEDWGSLLADVAAVSPMLNRLLHHGHVLKCGPWLAHQDRRHLGMTKMLRPIRNSFYLYGDAVPCPCDLPLSGKHRMPGRHPARACASVGAPVASLRCHTLRRADV